MSCVFRFDRFAPNTGADLSDDSNALCRSAALLTRLVENSADKTLVVCPHHLRPASFASWLQAHCDKAAADSASAPPSDAPRPSFSHHHDFYIVNFCFSEFHPASLSKNNFFHLIRRGIRCFFNRYPHPDSNRILTSTYPGVSDLLEDFCSTIDGMTHSRLLVMADDICFRPNASASLRTAAATSFCDFGKTLKYLYSETLIARLLILTTNPQPLQSTLLPLVL